MGSEMCIRDRSPPPPSPPPPSPPPPSPPPPPPGKAVADDHVAWVSQVGVESTESGQVTRTAAVTGAWDAGAVSQRAIRNGSDSVRGISAVCAGGYKNRMIGLNSQSTTDSTNYQSLDFAIFCTHTKQIKVYEKGKLEYTMAGTYSSSDSLQIVINDAGAVEYFKNEIRFYTSQQTPEYPLHADISVKAGSLTNVHWVERIASPPPSPPPPPSPCLLYTSPSPRDS